MGGNDEQELKTSLIAQRIAQGFRSYLMGLMTRGAVSEVECKYDSKTDDGVTRIEFDIAATAKPVPFETVKVQIEFKHR